jgi:hypothetical protein
MQSVVLGSTFLEVSNAPQDASCRTPAATTPRNESFFSLDAPFGCKRLIISYKIKHSGRGTLSNDRPCQCISSWLNCASKYLKSEWLIWERTERKREESKGSPVSRSQG